MSRFTILALVWLSFMAFWGWRETVEHTACIRSGGDVVLGWFQDGCKR